MSDNTSTSAITCAAATIYVGHPMWNTVSRMPATCPYCDLGGGFR